jgi:hypothetical protein
MDFCLGENEEVHVRGDELPKHREFASMFSDGS